MTRGISSLEEAKLVPETLFKSKPALFRRFSRGAAAFSRENPAVDRNKGASADKNRRGEGKSVPWGMYWGGLREKTPPG